MHKSAIKDLMYGGILELMNNQRYYYFSSVGAKYCYWTTEGQAAVCEFMNTISEKIQEAQAQELDARAKSMVLDGLGQPQG